mmetsp:Transcript_3848/g.5820  ORF Transcript_3848/g.5820 Transcript_3848/m.5820 type:complete len:126 (-) Transcript_3848:1416-1793(-)
MALPDKFDPWPSSLVQFALQYIKVDETQTLPVKRMAKFIMRHHTLCSAFLVGSVYIMGISRYNPTGHHEFAIIFGMLWEKVAFVLLMAKLALVIASSTVLRWYLFSLEMAKPDEHRNIDSFLLDW